jgi:hypothetical protein
MMKKKKSPSPFKALGERLIQASNKMLVANQNLQTAKARHAYQLQELTKLRQELETAVTSLAK